MTTITRASLIAKGLIKPSIITVEAKAFTVKADPRAAKARSSEQLGRKTERAMAILKAATHRERPNARS